MYLNLHVLFSLAGANPNRDDVGAPKTLVYGGVERARISSQAMTRAKRLAYETDGEGERSYRSTILATEISERAFARLTAQGVNITDKDRTTAEKAATKAVSAFTAKAKEESDKGDGPKATLVWLAEREIDNAAQKIADSIAAKTDPELDPQDIANAVTASLSIAAFGRMFANRPDLQTEAAIQRADAFTTHRSDIDIDYFTAVDDLTQGSGAGHLGTKLNTGGVYYWHANINVDELLQNWSEGDTEEARARLIALVRALLIALPSGGEATHAHHSLPLAVLAVPALRPVSLQTAYETPVLADRDGGYTARSITALGEEHTLTTKYAPRSFTGTALSAVLRGEPLPNTENAGNLDELAERVADMILQERQ